VSIIEARITALLAASVGPEDIQAIEVPTLLIVRPEQAVEMFHLLPRAQLAVFAGGHGTYIGEGTAARREDSQVRFGGASSSKKQSELPEREMTLLKRLPSLADVGNVATLLASDYASTMTGTVANMTCGQIVD
jgi:hypothetical protein